MNNAENITGQAILWAARLVGLFIIYLLVRHFKPTIFYKGWGSLRSEYSLSDPGLPAGLVLHPTSLRVGTEHYNQTAHLGLDEGAVYLQRPVLTGEPSLLRIPFSHLKLVAPPGRLGPLGLPVYGIFAANGVEVWIDSPYAEQLMARLPTP